ncbi:MAG: hypothetical protein E3J42_01185, partial [Dehalococcoidia bacterium]
MKKNSLLRQVFPLALILALLVTGLLLGGSLTAPGERQEIELPMIEKEQGNRGEVVPPMATTGLASTETTSDINVGPGSLVALASDERFDAALKEPPVLEQAHSLAGITEEYVPDQIIVKFKQEISSFAEESLHKSLATSVIYTSPYAGFEVLQITEG